MAGTVKVAIYWIFYSFVKLIEVLDCLPLTVYCEIIKTYVFRHLS